MFCREIKRNNCFLLFFCLSYCERNCLNSKKSLIRSPSKYPFGIFPYPLNLCKLKLKLSHFQKISDAFESPFSNKKIPKILVVLLDKCATTPRQDFRNEESVFLTFLQFFFYKNMAKA
jgi:hypothetical protein